MIIGARYTEVDGVATGGSYVVFGKADGTTVDLDAPEGGSFALDGELLDDFAGTAVGALGDVNDDGFADFVVGAPSADPNGPSSGRSYVVFGVPRG